MPCYMPHAPVHVNVHATVHAYATVGVHSTAPLPTHRCRCRCLWGFSLLRLLWRGRILVTMWYWFGMGFGFAWVSLGLFHLLCVLQYLRLYSIILSLSVFLKTGICWELFPRRPGSGDFAFIAGVCAAEGVSVAVSCVGCSLFTIGKMYC